MSELIENSLPAHNSRQQWVGLTSCKFPQNERKHFASQDMLKTIEATDVPFLGRKHFDPAYGVPSHQKSSLRAFPDIHNKVSTIQEDKYQQRAPFKPTSRSYGHKEKLHLSQNGSEERQYVSTIRTFDSSAKPGKEAYVEGMMGQKKRIEYLEEQRNLLDVRSLGDKIYKNPEYASGFFKDGGLVPGSTHDVRKKKKTEVKKSEQLNNKPKGTTWKDRVKQEEKDEEEKAVLSLFEWEKTTLKEANPKWRDPDEVELEAPKKQDVKIDQKNVKKPAAKK